MNIMAIFQTNWLDFLTWTLAICMGLALVVAIGERMMASEFGKKSKNILPWPKQLRKAS